MRTKCDCGQSSCPEPEYEVQIWVGFNRETNLPEHVCSAFFEGDRPLDTDRIKWYLFQEVPEGTQ